LTSNSNLHCDPNSQEKITSLTDEVSALGSELRQSYVTVEAKFDAKIGPMQEEKEKLLEV